MRLIILTMLVLAIIGAGLAFKECGRLCVAPNLALFDSERPFEYGWDAFDDNGVTILQDHPYPCSDLTAKLDLLLSEDERVRLYDNCEQNRVRIIYPPNEQLPPTLRKGSVGVLVEDNNQPISYSYSYRHEIIPQSMPRISALRRKIHAAAIRRILVAKYGPPIATGRYGYYSDDALPIDFSFDGPCEYWRTKNVTITLCVERMVLFDGIEMNLTFSRLDRSEHDLAIACAVEPKFSTACDNQSMSRPQGGLVNAMDDLAIWLAPRAAGCALDGLKPLAVVATLSADDQSRIAPILEQYEGEDLAWHAINTYNEFGTGGAGEIFGVSANPAVVYLLLQAAMQDSPTAMNEVGNTLLTCALGVEQDIPAGLKWLEKAAAAKNLDAFANLAYVRLTENENRDNARTDALALLKECADEERTSSTMDGGIQKCTEVLADLNMILEAAHQ